MIILSLLKQTFVVNLVCHGFSMFIIYNKEVSTSSELDFSWDILVYQALVVGSKFLLIREIVCFGVQIKLAETQNT